MGATLLPVEDRLAILELAARYNHLMDWGDAEGWADCFTSDGAFDAGPKLRAQGHDDLIAFMQRLIARNRPARHLTNNAIIEGSGDEGRLTINLLVYDLTPGGPRPANYGVYHDELARTEDGWRFRSRLLGPG